MNIIIGIMIIGFIFSLPTILILHKKTKEITNKNLIVSMKKDYEL